MRLTAKGGWRAWARAARIGGWIGLALLLWVVVTARGGDRRLFPGPPDASRKRIYLVDNGFHSDLAVPRVDLTERVGPLGEAVASTTAEPWIMLGWGDEGFFTARGVSAARAADGLRALFAPDNPSVVRIVGLPRAPDQVYPTPAVHSIFITDAGLRALEARAEASLAVDRQGRVVRGPRSGDADTAFFRSVEHFSAVRVCNHWTADLLHAAGLPITPVIDTLPAGLRLDLAWRAGA